MNTYLENIVETALKNQRKKVKKNVEIEEIVDVDGNVMGSKIPTEHGVATITAKKTTDQVVAATRQGPMVGNLGSGGTQRRFYGESDLTKAVGFEETMGQGEDYEDAKEYFNNELQMDDEDAKERLDRMGYEEDQDKIRLIEKSELESKIDGILRNKNMDMPRQQAPPDLSPILMRQLNALKETLQAHDIPVSAIIKYLQ